MEQNRKLRAHSGRRPILPILALWLAGSAPLAAAEIEVGQRVIEIPFPDAYVELTAEMSPHYEAMQAYQAPGNVHYMTLLPASLADRILRGESVDLTRYVKLETEKGISTVSISNAQFDELRGLLREQIEQMLTDAAADPQNIVRDGNAKLSDSLGADIAVEIDGLVALPYHLDTDTTFANSIYMTIGTSVNNTDAGSAVMAATTQIVHVKDKVLFLYVYAKKDELEWTREFAASWADSILAANPLSEEEQAAVDQPAPAGGIDWGRVLKAALIGALLAASVTLLKNFFGRRRKP